MKALKMKALKRQSPKQLFWIALPISAFSLSAPGWAKAPLPIDRIVPQLQQITQVEILLPDAIPEMDRVYVNGSATTNRYDLNFDYTADCHGATACHFGGIESERQEKSSPGLDLANLKRSLGARDSIATVKLADGNSGYFINTCGPYCIAAVIWQSQGMVYRLHIKNGTQAEVLELANAAIQAGVRTTATPQPFTSGKTATLTNQDVTNQDFTNQDDRSAINIRDGASTTAYARHIGYAGDQVEILDRTRATDGYYWYKVRFPDSGAIGWVRGDFVAIELN